MAIKINITTKITVMKIEGDNIQEVATETIEDTKEATIIDVVAVIVMIDI